MLAWHVSAVVLPIMLSSREQCLKVGNANHALTIRTVLKSGQQL